MSSFTESIKQAFLRDRQAPVARPSRPIEALADWPELPTQPQARRRATDAHPWAEERPAPLRQPGVRNLR